VDGCTDVSEVAPTITAVSLLEPDTGASLASVRLQASWTAPVGAVSPQWTCRTDGASLAQDRETFNADLSKIAVSSAVQPDGSDHVGYVDLGTGQFTDVTAATSQTGYGATPSQDGYPLFDPSTGDLWFIRGDGQAHDFNVATGKDTVSSQHFAIQGGTVSAGATGGAQPLTVRAGHPVVGYALLGPDNKTVAGGGAGTAASEPSIYIYNVSQATDSMGNGPGTAGGFGFYDASDVGRMSSDTGAVQAWLSATRLLVQNSSTGSFDAATVKHQDASADAALATTVLPTVSGRTNDDAVISPDHNNVIVRSAQGSVVHFYINAIPAPGDQPSQPRLTNVAGTTVISWQ
jgi:hypothetical protein